MSNILSRFSELKAFLKSIFRITFSGFFSFSIRFRKHVLQFRLHHLSRSRTAYQGNQFVVGQSRRSSHILSKFDAACFQPQLVELRRLFPKADKISTEEKKVSTLQGFCPLRQYLVRYLASGGTRCLWARCSLR